MSLLRLLLLQRGLAAIARAAARVSWVPPRVGWCVCRRAKAQFKPQSADRTWHDAREVRGSWIGGRRSDQPPCDVLHACLERCLFGHMPSVCTGVVPVCSQHAIVDAPEKA